MKKKTVEYLKEVDLEGIINKVCLYCNTIEEDLPDDIQNIFRKAQDLLDDPEAREYSISELQNIRGFIEKARQLTSKQDRLLKFHEMIEFSVGELDEGELAFRGKSLLMYL